MCCPLKFIEIVSICVSGNFGMYSPWFMVDDVCIHSGHDTTGPLSQKQAEYFFARQVCVII